MILVRLFKLKNNVPKINRFMFDLQNASEHNRVLNVQIVGNMAYITARVDVGEL